ncbi:MAG: hypothetical protein II814_00065, partial [Treponema sp.]|nr:hypothetical protein [Treponema sp.]
AALLAFASCKDSSGDGNTTGVVSGVPAKYALQMTVDATGNNIKVGDDALVDSNADTTKKIIADDATEGETELKLSKTGKRFFKEISAGLNNTEGFRTNIVLNVKDGTWTNSTSGRTAGAGMLFDFNEYKVGNDKTYDFFFLSFKPTISAGKIAGVTAYFERYSGVKKYKEGIYSGHTAASALGSNYIQETNSYVDNAEGPADINKDYTLKTVGKWLDTLYKPVAGATCRKVLANGTDWYNDADGNAIIGVDVKQMTKGVYTIRIGKITYDVGGTAQTFSPSAFKQTWKTTFAGGTEMGEGGETSTKTGDDGYIKSYANWTHVVKGDKNSNLKGGVLVYGFAPYGTKPVAAYYTCDTKLSSNKLDNTASQYDYVGDWNVANTLDADGVEDKIFYEEGNVVHEYIYY